MRNHAPADAVMAAPTGRRSDLDALRGVAMALGVVLHATLAYFPYPWPVQDQRQLPSLALVYAAIHGFRMPLFFLLSGFFTMLVLERRGLRSLVVQRILRILVPLVVAAFTILPLDKAVMSWAVQRRAAATASRSPLLGSILTGDTALVQRALSTATDLSARDPVSGVTPLALAAMGGDAEIVSALLGARAPIDAANKDGSTPLHAAAFMGQAEVVRVLLDRGANPQATDRSGKTPLAAIRAPAEIAVAVGEFLGLPGRDAADVDRGRELARTALAPVTPATGPATLLESVAARYRAALESPRFQFVVAGRSWHVFQTSMLDHLWFLWYLCWLVALFAIAIAVGLRPTGRHRWWLLAASCLPSALMWSPFGPDTALGILPTPHLLLFYGCFFWFGTATYAAEGAETPLGGQWRILVPLSLLVLFPAGIATIGNAALAAVLQPAYAWGMSIGLIGLFRGCLSRPSAGFRWFADSAYWIYLVHLPLVIAFQSLACDLPWPAIVKLLAVLAVVFAVLLATYRWCVRDTWVGRLLNGPRSDTSRRTSGDATTAPIRRAIDGSDTPRNPTSSRNCWR